MAESGATDEKNERPVRWMGRSRDDIREFPALGE
jgi:hypothetical protein